MFANQGLVYLSIKDCLALSHHRITHVQCRACNVLNGLDTHRLLMLCGFPTQVQTVHPKAYQKCQKGMSLHLFMSHYAMKLL